MAMRGRLPHPFSPRFIRRVIKQGFPYSSGRAVNSWCLCAWLTLSAAGVTILRPSRKDCLALEAGLREYSQSLPQPVPLKVTAGAVYSLTRLLPSLGQTGVRSFSVSVRITTM